MSSEPVAAEVSDSDDVPLAELGHRLRRLEQIMEALSDGVHAGAAIADALERVDERLTSIEDATLRVNEDLRVLVARAAEVADRRGGPEEMAPAEDASCSDAQHQLGERPPAPLLQGVGVWRRPPEGQDSTPRRWR